MGVSESAPSAAEEARLARNIRSARRSRTAFALLAILLPATFYLLLERQARRLAALGDHGTVTQATVTRLTHHGGENYVDYVYDVDGATFTWTARPEKAPSRVGERFPVVYLPEVPSLSRPGGDRAVGPVEAAANRRFGWKLETGLFLFLATAFLLTELQLRRLLRFGIAEVTDPKGYRRRLIGAGILVGPLLVLVFVGHAQEALSKGESLWPVVLGMALSLSIIVGTLRYLLREGPAQVATRSARLMRWVFPLSVGISVLLAMAALVRW